MLCMFFSEENEEMKEIYNRSYTKLFIEDLNENGLKDISLVTFEKDEKLTVEFMEQFKTVSEVSYDPFINSIQRIQMGHISKSLKAVVIDAGTGGSFRYNLCSKI